MTGKVVKILSFEYYVLAEGKTVKCSGRGRLKKDGDIFVGDSVEIKLQGKAWTIEKVLPRKNCLIRPYVANVDMAVIVVAPEPQADFVLADKIIINCIASGITPVLCYNKTDIANEEEIALFKREYSRFETIEVSAKTGEGVDELVGIMSGKVCCFAGQSAVGKTSLLNAITGNSVETGELSKKIARGKNTTRHTEAYHLKGDGLLVDTCGFSLLELDVDENDLWQYYDEFIEVGRCKFATCKHVSEPECAVKNAVENGTVARGRYERYVTIFNELKGRKKKYE